MIAPDVFDQIRREIVESGRDTRYKPAAYVFVLNGLEYYITKLGEKRHVSGQELARGLAEFALMQFGPLSHNVLTGWGISTTDDFGIIVYNMIDIGVMGRKDEDRLEDFFGVFDLKTFFEGQSPAPLDLAHIRTLHGA